jgi:hypothetical protein
MYIHLNVIGSAVNLFFIRRCENDVSSRQISLSGTAQECLHPASAQTVAPEERVPHF